MTDLSVCDAFFQAASQWICDDYSLEIRYLATKSDSGLQVIDAAIVLSPLAQSKPKSFVVEFGSMVAGHDFTEALSKAELENCLSLAARGKLTANGLTMSLSGGDSLDYYSEFPTSERWLLDLHLQVNGQKSPPLSVTEALKNDQDLRLLSIPFDGFSDLSTWLQLSDRRPNGQPNSINIRVRPPAGVALDESGQKSNRLKLKLIAHPKFDTTAISLAIREFPGKGIETRKQLGNSIAWLPVSDGLKTGELDVGLQNADSVQVMLIIGGRTVMRRWFFDPAKAVNARYVATQLFDKDLKQLRRSVLDTTDSNAFEKGIASLFFLLGFSPALQVEQDAPDILFTTPGGQLALVECTVKVSDFHSKVGKLVDRRNALVKTLEANSQNSRVEAFLICSLPKSQIATDEKSLLQHQIVLVTNDEITQALEQLRIPENPDDFLRKITLNLGSQQKFP